MELSYTIYVALRGFKRNIYLILDNQERRHICTITMVIIRCGCMRFLLRHVKKQQLGTLVDVVDFDYFKVIISVIYHEIVSSDPGVWGGTHVFTTQILQELPSFNVLQKIYPPKYSHSSYGYFFAPTLIRQ